MTEKTMSIEKASRVLFMDREATEKLAINGVVTEETVLKIVQDALAGRRNDESAIQIRMSFYKKGGRMGDKPDEPF